jgi:hypothetical protein
MQATRSTAALGPPQTLQRVIHSTLLMLLMDDDDGSEHQCEVNMPDQCVPVTGWRGEPTTAPDTLETASKHLPGTEERPPAGAGCESGDSSATTGGGGAAERKPVPRARCARQANHSAQASTRRDPACADEPDRDGNDRAGCAKYAHRLDAAHGAELHSQRQARGGEWKGSRRKPCRCGAQWRRSACTRAHDAMCDHQGV